MNPGADWTPVMEFPPESKAFEPVGVIPMNVRQNKMVDLSRINLAPRLAARLGTYSKERIRAINEQLLFSGAEKKRRAEPLG